MSFNTKVGLDANGNIAPNPQQGVSNAVPQGMQGGQIPYGGQSFEGAENVQGMQGVQGGQSAPLKRARPVSRSGQGGQSMQTGAVNNTAQPQRRVVNPRQSGLPNPNRPVQRPQAQSGQEYAQNYRRSQQPQQAQPAQAVANTATAPVKKKGKGKFIAIGVAIALIAAVAVGVVVKKGSAKDDASTQVVLDYELTGRYPIDDYINALNNYDAEVLKEKSSVSWLATEWKYANENKLRENWIKSVASYVKVSYPTESGVDADGNPIEGTSEEATMLNGESLTLSVVDYATLAETMKEDVNLITAKYEESGYKPTDYAFKDEMVDLMLDYLLEKAKFPIKEYTVPVVIDDTKGAVEEEVETATEETEASQQETYVKPVAYDFSNEIIATPLADLDAVGGETSDSESIKAEAKEGKGSSAGEGIGSDDVTNAGADTSSTTSVSEVVSPIYLGTHTETQSSTDEDGNTTSEDVSSYVVVNDEALDKLIFSSADFHLMLDTFGSLINDYEYEKEDAEIAVKKAEYDEKKKAADDKLKKLQDKARTEAENEGMSKKEIDAIVKKVKLSDKDAIDEWVENRIFSKEYVPESVIPYTWVGAYYALNEYKGESVKEAQVGDGTFERPAGIGTAVITKVLGEDKKYHDVKVTLLTYRLAQDAVDYAVSYSEKNRGFDASSAVKLIVYEVKVENLEDKPITINSEMFLSDAHSNQSSRTGKMYGFYSSATIKPHESDVLNDWGTSTEMEQKYVCWGKSFNRQYQTVWFKLLAGSGDEVPEYDATKSYVNGAEDTAESDEFIEDDFVDEGISDDSENTDIESEGEDTVA